MSTALEKGATISEAHFTVHIEGDAPIGTTFADSGRPIMQQIFFQAHSLACTHY